MIPVVSLMDNSYDNIEMLKHWMTKGVCHGELIIRPCDDSSLRTTMKCKVRENCNQSKERRTVKFVIFVVNGLAVQKAMGSEVGEGNQYAQMIASTFNCPYLSFKDDKPVVVVTHGDLFSLSDRASISFYLGELLGIPPAKQIFDIPESCDPVTELAIIDMLRYALEHADNNFPQDTVAEKFWFLSSLHFDFCQNLQRPRRLIHRVHRVRGSLSLSASVLLFIMIGIALLLVSIHQMHMRHEPEQEHVVDWSSIRHLWLEES